MNKKTRELVKNKYSNKCAYCGTELVKGWNVDHINPQVYGGGNDLENLNPSCKDCNNYKCHSQLETFRMYAKQMFNEKLHYLFKSKTKMQVAINMGVIKHTEWDGIFYYERVCNGEFPITYSREQVVNHAANDFMEGWNKSIDENKPDWFKAGGMAERILIDWEMKQLKSKLNDVTTHYAKSVLSLDEKTQEYK